MAAAAATAKELGLDTTPTNEDKDIAAKLTLAYADDPDKTSKAATPARVSELTPAALVLTADILEKYGHSIVENAVQLRHMVTNKLVQETENPDPRIRLKALELLGKHSDVGLFSEKSEVTVTHTATGDLRDRLRGKLTKLIDGVSEAVEEAITLDGETIDVDAELGLAPVPIDTQQHDKPVLTPDIAEKPSKAAPNIPDKPPLAGKRVAKAPDPGKKTKPKVVASTDASKIQSGQLSTSKPVRVPTDWEDEAPA
jgi:hypothetical protein